MGHSGDESFRASVVKYGPRSSYTIQGGPKKLHTKLVVIILSDLNRFSAFSVKFTAKCLLRILSYLAYVATRRGVLVSGVHRLNAVNACRARLVLGWVTVFRRVYHLGM